MATYNFTVVNNSLRVELVITGGDFEPRIDTFKSPSFTLATDRIKFYENGIYKMALSFNEFGTIDGVSPTDLEDALDLLDAATANFNWGGAAPYKSYVALLSQSGTSDPTATVLSNNLGGDVVWTRSGVGNYVGTLTGVFTADKTGLTGAFNNNADDQTIPYVWSFLRGDVDTVLLNTSDGAGNYFDSGLNQNLIEIRVYQ